MLYKTVALPGKIRPRLVPFPHVDELDFGVTVCPLGVCPFCGRTSYALVDRDVFGDQVTDVYHHCPLAA